MSFRDSQRPKEPAQRAPAETHGAWPGLALSLRLGLNQRRRLGAEAVSINALLSLRLRGLRIGGVSVDAPLLPSLVFELPTAIASVQGGRGIVHPQAAPPPSRALASSSGDNRAASRSPGTTHGEQGAVSRPEVPKAPRESQAKPPSPSPGRGFEASTPSVGMVLGLPQPRRTGANPTAGTPSPWAPLQRVHGAPGPAGWEAFSRAPFTNEHTPRSPTNRLPISRPVSSPISPTPEARNRAGAPHSDHETTEQLASSTLPFADSPISSPWVAPAISTDSRARAESPPLVSRTSADALDASEGSPPMSQRATAPESAYLPSSERTLPPLPSSRHSHPAASAPEPIPSRDVFEPQETGPKIPELDALDRERQLPAPLPGHEPHVHWHDPEAIAPNARDHSATAPEQLEPAPQRSTRQRNDETQSALVFPSLAFSPFARDATSSPTAPTALPAPTAQIGPHRAQPHRDPASSFSHEVFTSHSWDAPNTPAARVDSPVDVTPTRSFNEARLPLPHRDPTTSDDAPEATLPYRDAALTQSSESRGAATDRRAASDAPHDEQQLRRVVREVVHHELSSRPIPGPELRASLQQSILSAFDEPRIVRRVTQQLLDHARRERFRLGKLG